MNENKLNYRKILEIVILGIICYWGLNHYEMIFKSISKLISGVLQLNNINFFETLDIALFFCQFFCIFYSYFLVLCDIIVSGGVSYG